MFAAAADWQTYSSANGACPVQFDIEALRMIPLETDLPLHPHIRRILNPFFTPEAVASAEQAAGTIVESLLDECARTGVIGVIAHAAAGLGNVAYHLATNPDLRASLRDADDDTLSRAVDEFLRHDPPGPLAGRTLTADVELRGCPMKGGDRIMLNWAGASRGPEVFPEPDTLDLDRENVARHTSFGAGVHRCMGNHLARRELKAAVRGIAGLATFELVEGAEVNWRAAFARGPATLPVRCAR